MKKPVGAFIFCFLLLAGVCPLAALQLPGAPLLSQSLPAPAQGTLEQDKYLESLLPAEKFKVKKDDSADSAGEKPAPAPAPAVNRPLNYGDDAFLESFVPRKPVEEKKDAETEGDGEGAENSQDRPSLPTTAYDQDAFLESLLKNELKKSEAEKPENGKNRSVATENVSQESFLESLLTQNKFQMTEEDATPTIASRTQTATLLPTVAKTDTVEVLSRPFHFNTPLQEFLDIKSECSFLPSLEQKLMQFSPWKTRVNQTKAFDSEIYPQILGYLIKVRTDGKSIQMLQDSSASSLMTMDFSPASETERMSNRPMGGGGGGGGDDSRAYFGRLIKTQILFWGMLISVLFFMYWNRKVF